MADCMYNCLKLRERHKEYNEENKTSLSFCAFLRQLQYSGTDIKEITDTMSESSKRYYKNKQRGFKK